MEVSEKPTLPAPARFAVYPGKVEAQLGSLRGPNTLGEYLVIVDVNYDAVADKTRIGYAFARKGNPQMYMDRWVSSNHVLPEAVLNNASA